MIDTGLQRRVVLVSGATQGVGRTAARLFATEGAWIAVNYRADVHGAKAVVDTIRSAGGRALLTPGDIRSPEGAWMVVRYVEHEWAQIDILVHTTPLLGPDEAAPAAAPLLSTVVPGMRERGWGRVVLVCPSGATAGGDDLGLPHGAAGVLMNVIRLTRDNPVESLDEVAARAVLFLGSAWNMGITGATLDVARAVMGEQAHG
ncbi:MAG TPA: SDR family NAD(P)-dependent oxidoreductase [Roseiflexaceae bacterium]|jgi:3-oxoacyl-[acyl-carrier protein] reductase